MPFIVVASRKEWHAVENCKLTAVSYNFGYEKGEKERQ